MRWSNLVTKLLTVKRVDFVPIPNDLTERLVAKLEQVGTYAQLAPRYDGDDESFTVVYIDNKGNTVGMAGMIFKRDS